MKLILLIFLANLLESYFVHSEASGYYWRDYYGQIPDDAFPGGSDINGDPIYIGLSMKPNLLYPSKIYGTNKKVYYEDGLAEHEVTNQVKILCTQHPEQLEWILTDNEKFKILTSVNLVLGGYQPNYILYIGRVRANGEIVVGKVAASINSPSVNLWTTAIGKSVSFSEFEILSFNDTTPLIPAVV